MGGENSKLAFRKCVFRLAEQRSLPDSAEDAWSPFWLLPEGPHDVFSLVTPADIRRIRDNAQENFIKLTDKVFDRLLMLKAAADLAKNQANLRQLLNCIRILTRLLPFAYEACPDGSTVEDILLWTQRPRPGSGADYVLGKQLVAAVIDLLFTSGFTIPPATVGEDAAVRYTIWENGIGQTSSLGSSKEHVNNRVEVMRLLLVLCSKTMYLSPAQAVALPNRALHTIAYNANKKMVLCLLCSLINTALKDRTQGWSIPYRNTSALDPSDVLSLQAMQMLFIVLDYQVPQTRKGKAQAAGEGKGPDPSAGANAGNADAASNDENTPSMVLVTSTATASQNLFSIFIAKLHRSQEFDYLVSSILRLLEEAMNANLSILASVTKQPAKHAMPQEAAILLWSLLENNKLFKDYVVDHNSSLRLFSVLLYFMLNGYNDPAQAGMVRTISHILHYLSEDSSFATRLMQPFDQSILPSNMRVPDTALTHADFMINTVFTLLSSSKPYLIPVYSDLLLLVRNVSPYLTQVSQTTADKLVSLFDIISSPAFIISEPYHVRWLIYLIEVFDYVVHYRVVDNPHLIYSMVKSRSCFTRLKAFSLAAAEKDLAALREKKSKADARRTIGGTKPRQTSPAAASGAPEPAAGSAASTSEDSKGASTSDGSSSPALSDKARGKLPETKPASASARAEQAPGHPASTTAMPRSGSTAAGARQFQPTAEWVFSWLPDLPLDPIIAVLDALAVHIDHIALQVQADAEAAAAPRTLSSPGHDVKSSSPAQSQSLQQGETGDGVHAEAAAPVASDPTNTVIQWLSSDAMLKVLPDLEDSMPEVKPRLQGLSPALVVWFRSLLWSLIYASGMKPFGLWKNTHVRLFVVRSAQ
ncbi:hypothetical protein GQ54DRAFT_260865 [Martensiomyces pterosporus]|nr:hypothetical protein GQ54DRAFT_260865 [Martensiomyces pterosporus]